MRGIELAVAALTALELQIKFGFRNRLINALELGMLAAPDFSFWPLLLETETDAGAVIVMPQSLSLFAPPPLLRCFSTRSSGPQILMPSSEFN